MAGIDALRIQLEEASWAASEAAYDAQDSRLKIAPRLRSTPPQPPGLASSDTPGDARAATPPSNTAPVAVQAPAPPPPDLGGGSRIRTQAIAPTRARTGDAGTAVIETATTPDGHGAGQLTTPLTGASSETAVTLPTTGAIPTVGPGTGTALNPTAPAATQPDSAVVVDGARAEAQKKADEAAHKEEAIRAELAEAFREQNELYLKKVGRISFWAFVGLSVVALLAGLNAAGVGQTPDFWSLVDDGKNPLIAAAAAAILLSAVLLLLSLAKRNSGRLVSMLIGKDGRFSTTYFQAWVWTLALVWALLFFSLLAATGAELTESGAGTVFGINPDYLILLGGPFAALIIAQQIDQSKTTAGTLQKVETSETRVSDLFSNDSHRADLVDMQYLLFNVVALAVFFGALWAEQTTLPDIPDQLLLLTSGAALGYVAKKAVQQNAPVISSVVARSPETFATIGGEVLVTGSNFVPTGGDTVLALNTLRVKFGSAVVKPTLRQDAAPGTPSASTTQSLLARVPDLSADGLTERTVDVVVVSSSGTESPPFSLRVFSPVLRVRLEPVKSENGIVTVTVVLLDESKRSHPARLVVGDAVFDAFWDDTNSASVQLGAAMVDGKKLTVSSGGASFTAQLALSS